MDTNLSLISNRREEVRKIVAEAEKALAAARAELQELEVAGKTLARLTGAEWDSASAPDATPTPPVIGVVEQVEQPRTELLMALLREMHIPPEGVSPKEVRIAFRNRYGIDIRGEYVSTQMWRAADRGTLVTVSKGRYRLKES